MQKSVLRPSQIHKAALICMIFSCATTAALAGSTRPEKSPSGIVRTGVTPTSRLLVLTFPGPLDALKQTTFMESSLNVISGLTRMQDILRRSVTAAARNYNVSLDNADVMDVAWEISKKFDKQNALVACANYLKIITETPPEQLKKQYLSQEKAYANVVVGAKFSAALTALDTAYADNEQAIFAFVDDYVKTHRDAYVSGDVSKFDIRGFKIGTTPNDIANRANQSAIERDALTTELARKGQYSGTGHLPIGMDRPSIEKTKGGFLARDKGVSLQYTCAAEGSKLYKASLSSDIDRSLTDKDIFEELKKKYGAPSLIQADQASRGTYVIWGGEWPNMYVRSNGVETVPFDRLSAYITPRSYTVTLHSVSLEKGAERCISNADAAQHNSEKAKLQF